MSSLADKIARARETVARNDRDAKGFPAPTPWSTSANPLPMVWADDGDAIVMQMDGAGEPYFEKPVTALIVLAVNALPALLDVAEAGAQCRDACRPSAVRAARAALDAALARLSEVL